jgi:vacuolar-type H+-ATPase subunit I/STV1
MKEGYLQIKIQELNDKCRKIDQMIKMEKSKIKLLEENVGGLKNLIKKLKDLENFKENLHKEIKKENEELIMKEIEKISAKIGEKADSTVKNKIDEIEKLYEDLKDITKEKEKLEDLIFDLNVKINYLMKHNELLMMKLTNKNVISFREVDELDKRSKKKNEI